MDLSSVWNITDKNDEIVIGIDFGTSTSCVSIWNPQKLRSKVIKCKAADGKDTHLYVYYYTF